MSNQRRPDVQELRPPIIADLPCHLHGGAGRRTLHYTEPFPLPSSGKIVLQPYNLYEGVRPFGLIVRLMELYRALEREVGTIIQERDNLYADNIAMKNEFAKKDKALAEYERMLKRKKGEKVEDTRSSDIDSSAQGMAVRPVS